MKTLIYKNVIADIEQRQKYFDSIRINKTEHIDMAEPPLQDSKNDFEPINLVANIEFVKVQTDLTSNEVQTKSEPKKQTKPQGLLSSIGSFFKK